ncbi:MAG: hypothetical protein HQL32_07800 [Planctomycetes bacterium]|nr:hypothetical protein [Planctomycetota bacterium]
MRTNTRIAEINDISTSLKGKMFSLMERYYENVDYKIFEDDLYSKDKVILLEQGDTLCGFSTQKYFLHSYAGEQVGVVFSGDTIVDRPYRGGMHLSICWGRMMLDYLQSNGSKKLYWLLTSKGYKTYRFLSVFFNTYYPGLKGQVTPFEKELCQNIALYLFGDRMMQDPGVISAASNAQCVIEDEGEVTQGRRSDPHVRFFEERNPRHSQGDELVCLARFEKSNLRPAILRQLEVIS